MTDRGRIMENPMKYNIATRAQEKCVVEAIVPKQTDKVLDVGCGLGYLTSKIQGTVYGIDLDVGALEFANRKYDASFIVGDALNLPFKDYEFNHILAMGIVEHVPDDRLFMKEMKRVIKDNGTLVLSTPTLEGIVKPTRTCHEKGGQYHYKDNYSEGELISLVKDGGFINLEVGYTLSFFTRIAIEGIKAIYNIINPSFEKQSDVLKDVGTFKFKIYRAFFPFILVLIKLDDFLSRFIKGSCIIGVSKIGCKKP